MKKELNTIKIEVGTHIAGKHSVLNDTTPASGIVNDSPVTLDAQRKLFVASQNFTTVCLLCHRNVRHLFN